MLSNSILDVDIDVDVNVATERCGLTSSFFTHDPLEFCEYEAREKNKGKGKREKETGQPMIDSVSHFLLSRTLHFTDYVVDLVYCYESSTIKL